MWRVICAGAIGVTLLSGRPLLAQGPPAKDSVQKLQAELEALKLLIKDGEARLEKAKADQAKKPGFGKGKGPWDKPGEWGKRPRGFGPPGFDKWGRYKPGEFGKGKGYAKG